MRRSLFRTLTLITLLAGATAQAGINKWTALGPEGGGNIYRVELPAGAPNVAYAIASSGFHRSADGGAHWVHNDDEFTPLALDFAVDPTEPTRVYLAINNLPGRLLVSTNAGVSFSTLRVFDQLETPLGIAVGGDGTTVYTIGQHQVFQSKDRGQTWQARTSLPDNLSFGFRGVHIDPADSRTLYVVRAENLLVTRDEGVTWAEISPGPPFRNEDLAIDPSDTRRVWVGSSLGLYFSGDGGVSWTRKNTDWTVSVALDPHTPSLVYTGIFGGALRKGDGTTFTDITGNVGAFHPHTITVSPHDGSTLYAANSHGLWFTNNGGASWQPRNSGLVGAGMGRFAPSPVRGRTYVVGNLLATIEDGSDVLTTRDEVALFDALHFQSSEIGALTPVSESGGGLMAAVGDRIALSIDDGITWSQLPYTPEPNDAIFDLAATTTFPSVYYASSAYTLKRSVDHGATWQTRATGLPTDKSPGLLMIAPSDPSTIYAGPCDRNGCNSGAGVYKSTNGGDSWSAANAGIEDSRVAELAIHPSQPNIVYAATNKGLLKTVDGGTTWTRLSWPGSTSALEASGVALDPANPNVVYAAGSFFTPEVARSDDGGQTWFHIVTGFYAVPWIPSGVAVDPGRPDTIRVGTASGVHQISLRPDVAIEVSELAANLTVGVGTPYTVTVSNVGHLRSTGLSIELQLPAGATEISANPSTGTCAVAGATITCTAPLLVDSLTITGNVQPIAAGPFALVATVHGDQTETDSTNNAVTRTSSASTLANLGFYSTTTVEAVAGSAMQLFLSFINGGPSPTTGVHVATQIPAGLVINSFKLTGDGAGTCTRPQTDMLVCDFSTLKYGGVVSLEMSATASAAGTYQMVSTLSSDGTDLDPSLNTRTQTVVVSAASAPTGPPPISGGGGGGGALSPLFLLGLLGFALRGASARGRCPSRQTTKD